MHHALGGEERAFAIFKITGQGKINDFSKTLMFETLYEYATDPRTRPPSESGLDRLTPGARWRPRLKGPRRV